MACTIYTRQTKGSKVLYVSLLYGMSFVIMGFAMAFQSFSSFRILPKRPLLLLASFGITHGIFELQRMFQTIEMRGFENVSPVYLDYTSSFLLPISFVFLLAFAIELLVHEEIIGQYWRVWYFLAPLTICFFVMIPGWSKFPDPAGWPLRLEIASRYFLAFPAGVLSSFALLKVARRIQDHERYRFVLAMYASSFVLLVYGIAAGLLMLNPTGFEGFPEHGISTSPIILEIRTFVAISLTFVISYAFVIELANVDSGMRKMRDEFSAVLAHDIGSILRAIKMSSDILVSEETLSELGEKTQKLVRIIESNIRLLQNLISELFDLSLIELRRFKLKRQTGDLRATVRQACEQMRPILGSRHLIILIPEHELSAYFDAQRITQILINLLSNAAKYSFLNSEVIVSAYDSGPNVKVEVTSTGPAISEGEASKLFTRYYRSRKTAGQRGAGLGLFIVKELAEAHGGSVFFEPREAGKNVFGFLIPRHAPSEKHKGTQPFAANGDLSYTE